MMANRHKHQHGLHVELDETRIDIILTVESDPRRVEIHDRASGAPIALAVLPQPVSCVPDDDNRVNGADLLDAIIETAGAVPSTIVVDRGLDLSNADLLEACMVLGIELVHHAPYRPRLVARTDLGTRSLGAYFSSNEPDERRGEEECA